MASGATPPRAIDDAVVAVRRGAARWTQVSAVDRVALLERIQDDLWRVGSRWVAANLEAKGFEPGGMAEAEEWLFLGTVLRSVRMLRNSVRSLDRTGQVRLPASPRQRADGRVVLRTLPADRLDRLVYRGLVGDVWFEPDRSVADIVGSAPRQADGDGEVAVVLGAGNASMIPPVDVLHQLFVEGRGVVLKPNPVSAYLDDLLEEAFACLIEPGYLRLVGGGAAEGAHLCTHPDSDAVHVTGSRATFHAIHRLITEERPAGSPVPELTAELGNVSPVIVVPGPWTQRDLEVQASHVATWLVANAGFGCLTPRVLVQHRRWAQRDAFRAALERALQSVPPRAAWYPGAADRHATFIANHPDPRLLGAPATGALPWTVAADVDPTERDHVWFQEEAFCSFVAETALDAPSPEAFVDAAVEFANDTLWGSLNATLLVHPASRRDPAMRRAIGRAVASLRYGCVTVNAPAFAAYHVQVLPWGAHPDPDWQVTGGGRGRTANTLFLDGVEKTVLQSPFRSWPDPITVHARHPERFARRIAAYEATGGLRALPGLMASAV